MMEDVIEGPNWATSCLTSETGSQSWWRLKRSSHRTKRSFSLSGIRAYPRV